ncbi:MAG: hypothetical protein MZV63_67555 [Marinilabiliales bacterium]|nr:hypothetical protein [Marinilabiliales bacterium]
MNGIAYNPVRCCHDYIIRTDMFYAGAVWFVLLAMIGATDSSGQPDIREITIGRCRRPRFRGSGTVCGVVSCRERALGDLTAVICNNLFDESAPAVTGAEL